MKRSRYAQKRGNQMYGPYGAATINARQPMNYRLVHVNARNAKRSTKALPNLFNPSKHEVGRDGWSYGAKAPGE